MENKFVDGLFAKPPHERAPDFVKGRLSIKPAQFMDWLNQHLGKEWLNLDIKVSKDGKWYCAVNDYDPKAQDPLAPARQALAQNGQNSNQSNAPDWMKTEEEVFGSNNEKNDDVDLQSIPF